MFNKLMSTFKNRMNDRKYKYYIESKLNKYEADARERLNSDNEYYFNMKDTDLPPYKFQKPLCKPVRRGLFCVLAGVATLSFGIATGFLIYTILILLNSWMTQ